MNIRLITCLHAISWSDLTTPLLELFSVCFGKLKKLEESIRFPIDGSNVYQFGLKIKTSYKPK